MNAAVIAAACITALVIFFFFVEWDLLSEGHARVRTQLLNVTRWAIVIALSWVLIPAAFSDTGPQRAATIIGMAGLIGAVMLIPVRWFVRLGGLQPAWELRRAKVEVSQLASRVRRAPGSVTSIRFQDAVDRVSGLRTPETAELCDLLLAELADLRAGSESWNEAGRRSIRIDDLSRRFWPDDMPAPDYDPNEATFRWHLYRTFGRMMDLGAAEASSGSRAQFTSLLDNLEGFRRADTRGFIDLVKQSADRWLLLQSGSSPWISSFDFEPLGPDGLAEIKKIWGRDAAMWGADLDEGDRAALKRDLARRAAASGAAASSAAGSAAQAGPSPEKPPVRVLRDASAAVPDQAPGQHTLTEPERAGEPAQLALDFAVAGQDQAADVPPHLITAPRRSDIT